MALKDNGAPETPGKRELNCEAAWRRIPESIAVLMTTCYSVRRDRTMDRLEHLLNELVNLRFVHDWDIRPQEAPEGEWLLRVIIKTAFVPEYHIIMMGLHKVEGGFDQSMSIEHVALMQ